jgi:hypothetical protein
MHLARHLVAASAHLQPTAKAGVALATQSGVCPQSGRYADSHVPPQLAAYTTATRRAFVRYPPAGMNSSPKRKLPLPPLYA